jgi:Spy/CpxP family protein refolding chaperone
MKRVIGMAVLAAAVGTVAVAAQPAGQGRRGGRDGRMQAMVEYLGLSPQQQEQWRTLHQKHHEDMQPLREEGRALHERLQQALEADEPDQAVGEAAKAVYAHRQAMKAARETFEAQLLSVLDEAQKEKFEAFKAARQMGGPGRPGRGHGRGSGGRPGFGSPGRTGPEGTGSAPPVEG